MKKMYITLVFSLLITNLTFLNANNMDNYMMSQIDIKGENQSDKSPTALMCLSDMSFGLNPSMNLGLDLAGSLTGVTESIGEIGTKATNLVADTISNITDSLTGNAMMMNMAIESAAYTLAFMECAGEMLSPTDMAKFSTCMQTANETEMDAGANAGIKMTGDMSSVTKTKPAVMAKCAQKQASASMNAIWECTKKRKNAKIDDIIKFLNKKIQASMTSIKQTSKQCSLDKEMAMSSGLTAKIVENGFAQTELRMLEVAGVSPMYKSEILKKLNADTQSLTNGETITYFESLIIKAYKTPIYVETKTGKKPLGSVFQNGIESSVRIDFARFADYLYRYIQDADSEINAGVYSAIKYKNLINMLKNKSSNKILDTLYSPFTSNKTMWNCVTKNGVKEYVYSYKPKDFFTKSIGLYQTSPDEDEIFVKTLHCINKKNDITSLVVLTSSLSESVVSLIEKEIELGTRRYMKKIKVEIEASKSKDIKIKDEIKGTADVPGDVYELKKVLYENGANIQGDFEEKEE